MNSQLLRLDLVRRHWPMYLFVALVTIAVPILMVWRAGISTSPDFIYRYDPGANELLQSMGLAQLPPQDLSPYAWARIGYMVFVAACYLVWGIGNATALIYTQMAIVWVVQPLMFHILLHTTGRAWFSFLAMGVWLAFFDAYQWNTWALPDALFRVVVLAVFFVSLRLWEQGRQRAFAVTVVGGTLLASTLRVEAVLYAMPALWLVARGFGRSSKWVRVVVPVTALGGLILIAPLLRQLGAYLDGWFSQGTVFLSVDPIEGVSHVTPPVDPSIATRIGFVLKVVGLRAWYSITPLPAYWSHAHQYFYAAFMIPFYALTLAAMPTAIRRRWHLFLICLWIFIASVILRMMTHVDSPMRYAYTPQVFLFFCAVWGTGLWLGGSDAGIRVKIEPSTR